MIDPKYLNRWVTEDISEEDDQELYTVLFFMKKPGTNKHCVFGFIEFEDPPLVSFTMNIVEDAEREYEIADKSNRWHPLNHVSQSALNHGMMGSIFSGEWEAK